MNPPWGLHDRTIVVTGAAGLLGREHCAAVLSAGAAVLMLDSDEMALDRAVLDLGKRYSEVRVAARSCDVTIEQQVVESLELGLANLPPLMGLVNNASMNPRVEDGQMAFVGAETVNLADLYREFEVGLGGYLVCARNAARLMSENGTRGSIVNVLSDFSIIAPDQRRYQALASAENPSPAKPVGYSIVKHGQLGLTRYLATYWADRGIRVNGLSPGAVGNETPNMLRDAISDGIPLGRLASPGEFRSALVFLLSDASSYMTGGNLVLDGGRSVW